MKKLKAADDLESAPKELKPFYRKIKDIKKKRAELDTQKEPKNPDELIRSPFGVECIKAAYKQASDIQYELGIQFKTTDKDGISFEIISRSTKNARKDYIPLGLKYDTKEEAQNHINSLMNEKDNLDKTFKPVLAKLDSIKDAVAQLLKN